MALTLPARYRGMALAGAALLLMLSGCSCSGYSVRLLPERGMNQKRSAVQLDFVWLTAADEQLMTLGADEWFASEDSPSIRLKDRTITHTVTLDDARVLQEIYLGQEQLKPPEGLDVIGFVIFAGYNNIKDAPQNLRVFHPDPSRANSNRSCEFKLRLEKKSIYMEAKPGKFLGIL